MNSITIKRARELLGTESYRLSDAQIKAKIGIIMVLANRCFDIIEPKNNHGENTNPIINE